jgi:chemotaxis protein methyltransferase CheR
MVPIKEDEFRRFSEYIKANYGIHFKDEKKTLIEGRLGLVLASLNFESLSEYMAYVTADKTGAAAAVMLDKITTNHTFFMREPAHFHFFRDVVLPYLAQTVRDHDLRIWSAACSSGEEPYTLAMIMDEYFGPAKPEWDTKILATDLSQGILAAARAGLYGPDRLGDIPESWKRRYFKQNAEGQFALSDRIKNEVIFRKLNLMDAAYPFKSNMHVIFCRNVMIYFDSETKDRLVERLYDITEPGGFLFVGHSESLNRERTRYRYVMPAIYRKE